MKKQLSTICASVICLAGCMVGPNYKAPVVQAPGNFSSTTQPATTQPIDLARWWESFNDPVLNRLIASGLDGSLDIWLAEARIRESRALVDENWATLFPTVDSSANYARQRASKNTAGNISGALGGLSATGTSASTSSLLSNLPDLSGGTTNSYQAGFDAGWELDVFGGNKRSIESAQASLEAQMANRRNVTITLLGDIARNYITLRGGQHERAAVRDNLEAQKSTLSLTKSKFRAGIATDLDVVRQEAQVASTASQLPSIETEIQQAIHRLGVLLDREPLALEAELAIDAPLPSGPPAIPAGLPSELLRRRPDIQQAERNLAAASANIGVAVAELYPKFSLTGSFGLESDALKTFTRTSSIFSSFGPSVSWRIFDANQLLANVRIEKARYEQAYIQYRQTILRALQEVEDALVAYDQEQIRRDALLLSVNANIRAVDLAKHLNQAGVVDFLNVLTAQQSLFVVQDQMAQSEQTVSTNLVALYKALGGGWEVNDPSVKTAENEAAKRKRHPSVGS